MKMIDLKGQSRKENNQKKKTTATVKGDHREAELYVGECYKAEL